MTPQRWYKGRVIGISDETNDIRRFWVEVPELASFQFKPGQYVTLDLPIHEELHLRHRHYSIASWPSDSNVFELVIVMRRHGAGTPYFFEKVSIGTELILHGPLGTFTLKEPIDKDLYLICTGTGIAPFRSMVHYIHNNAIPHKNIYLIFGSRTRAALLYYDELIKLQESVPGFHYIPTLSQEQWDGNMGYVHPIYQSLCAERKPANFFLAGYKGMIEDARKLIGEMGYDSIFVQ